ncbi:hypothetical protein DFH06DRAFT_1141936 [Mycena polygramma]|nr:hypothetical protein DFH06DRAFT_1141936 [Mycena polygramma]
MEEFKEAPPHWFVDRTAAVERWIRYILDQILSAEYLRLFDKEADIDTKREMAELEVKFSLTDDKDTALVGRSLSAFLRGLLADEEGEVENGGKDSFGENRLITWSHCQIAKPSPRGILQAARTSAGQSLEAKIIRIFIATGCSSGLGKFKIPRKINIASRSNLRGYNIPNYIPRPHINKKYLSLNFDGQSPESAGKRAASRH